MGCHPEFNRNKAPILASQKRSFCPLVRQNSVQKKGTQYSFAWLLPILNMWNATSSKEIISGYLNLDTYHVYSVLTQENYIVIWLTFKLYHCHDLQMTLREHWHMLYFKTEIMIENQFQLLLFYILS